MTEFVETFKSMMSYVSGIKFYKVLVTLFTIYLITYVISYFLRKKSRRHHKNRILNSRLISTIEEKLFLLQKRKRVEATND